MMTFNLGSNIWINEGQELDKARTQRLLRMLSRDLLLQKALAVVNGLKGNSWMRSSYALAFTKRDTYITIWRLGDSYGWALVKTRAMYSNKGTQWDDLQQPM